MKEILYMINPQLSYRLFLSIFSSILYFKNSVKFIIQFKKKYMSVN